ncbi:MAG: hypothetical protein GX662_08825 [Trichococcus flocculiformis]|uniref:Antitoxin SocA-like Panacea domain-containing protein n=1 Tax=Trichococcus flocculiformis TaxID=82803 RepID=A0A847D787_9LACT|nr:hypothetical protein [Trichococcus flocculiformis]NLD32337.1 hypothetical protein [Trichococcus flocculiformis]
MCGESFEGWEEGPVLPELHFFFEEGYDPFEPLEMKKLTEREQFILDRVVFAYGQYEGWYLADLARREASWRNSRPGVAAEATEPKLLELADIHYHPCRVHKQKAGTPFGSAGFLLDNT